MEEVSASRDGLRQSVEEYEASVQQLEEELGETRDQYQEACREVWNGLEPGMEYRLGWCGVETRVEWNRITGSVRQVDWCSFIVIHVYSTYVCEL